MLTLKGLLDFQHNEEFMQEYFELLKTVALFRGLTEADLSPLLS
jgi:hypothetical protein